MKLVGCQWGLGSEIESEWDVSGTTSAKACKSLTVRSGRSNLSRPFDVSASADIYAVRMLAKLHMVRQLWRKDVEEIGARREKIQCKLHRENLILNHVRASLKWLFFSPGSNLHA
ncbi:hypothetical protein LINGRAHAP2_LOCUS35217 [Linum grandiflorum]